MIAYLSGAMEYVADEGAGWRTEMAQWIKSELGHDVIDPVITSQVLVEKIMHRIIVIGRHLIQSGLWNSFVKP